MGDRRRRADAERNDERLLEAARAAVAELGAGVSVDDIARRAGVGVATLYRRFASKEALLAQVCREAVDVVRAEADTSLASLDVDAWGAVAAFIRRCVEQHVGALAPIAGTFSPPEQLVDAADAAHQAVATLVTRAQAAGALRRDVTAVDVLRLIAVHSRGLDQNGSWERTLGISLDGLRDAGRSALVGAPPTWRDERGRWLASGRN